jgi:hypothetical protein
MPRIKERPKFVYKPSTHEVFACLASMIRWSRILYEHGPDKKYKPFLKRLNDCDYIYDSEGSISVKRIAEAFSLQTTKVNKWMHEIYKDILELNNEQEHLFINNRLSVTLFFSYFDNSAAISLGLDVLPRVYEELTFQFIKAKIGTDRFWVKRVEHEVCDEGVKILVWLEGSILNRYREMAVEEASFKGWIGFMDRWHKSDSEIDEVLLRYLTR